MYEVHFRVAIYHGGKNYQAKAQRILSFLPFLGMHLGGSQLLTVSQVHWLGLSDDQKPIFRCDCRRIQTYYEHGYPRESDPPEKIWSSLEDLKQDMEKGAKGLVVYNLNLNWEIEEIVAKEGE
jgi:hypothetical protein